MCVDLFAVGHAITIPFLHEQIWFDVDYESIDSYLIVDAFISNDGVKPIEQIRLQFPHYVALDGVEILSTDAVFRESDDFRNSPYNWIGRFEPNHERRRINLTLHFDYDDPDRSARLDEVKPLFKDVPPQQLLPAATKNVENHLAAMQAFDRAALVLTLVEELPAHETGWLRLKVRAQSWPRQADIVPLRSASVSSDASKFICRTTVLSPVHLRRDLLEKLDQPANNQWHSELVAHGWQAPNTLTRVVDHRISIVFDRSVDVSHVSSIPEGAFWAAGPMPLPTDTSRCVLHFATGSTLNESRDVVAMARRICDYCRFLMRDPPNREKAPSVDHLITRFGATNHEATGDFINQMLKCNVLQWVDSGDRQTVMAAPENELASRMMVLRKRYTNPEDAREFGNSFRELHAFRIAFTLCWTALSQTEQRQAELLRRLVHVIEDGHIQRDASRRAVVVSCTKCVPIGLPAVPVVSRFARELAAQLTDRGAFDVSIQNDVGSRKELIEKLREHASPDCDMLLFWYIGHGRLSDNVDRLQLGATREEIVEWREIVEWLMEYPSASKVALLDCCHAGQGIAQAADLNNSLICGTTGAHHSAESGGFVGDEDPAGKYPNFTFAATAVLREHSDSLALSFKDLFREAQDRATENRNPLPPLQKSVHEHLVVDPDINRRALVSTVVRDLGEILRIT
jgi:hypothetical protein